MAGSIKCSCGREVALETLGGGGLLRCPDCDAVIQLAPAHVAPAEQPAPAPDSDAGELQEVLPPDSVARPYDGEVLEPRHVERISGPAGQQWKVTCLCGKRLLAPFRHAHRTGRCPKCGRRLNLPGYRPQEELAAPHVAQPPPAVSPPAGAPGPHVAQPPPAVSPPAVSPPAVSPPAVSPPAVSPDAPARARQAPPRPRPAAPQEAERPAGDDEPVAVIVEPSARRAPPRRPSRERPDGRDAAIHTAEQLRSRRASSVGMSSAGLVSAWPFGGVLARLLAGFIDLTLGVVAALAVVALGSLGVLPEASRDFRVVVAAFLAAVLLNDCLLQVWCGGVGKRLVVLTVRTRGGQDPAPLRLVCRGFFKWLLIPGWIVVWLHPAQRALHDLVCGTVVLKGRPHPRG